MLKESSLQEKYLHNSLTYHIIFYQDLAQIPDINTYVFIRINTCTIRLENFTYTDDNLKYFLAGRLVFLF